MTAWFAVFAHRSAELIGHPWAFVLACLIIILWAALGPFFEYSDTWQLVVNTGTTVITFLMVFVLQNSQNRNSTAEQLKLDEVLRALPPASNRMISIEDLTEAQLQDLLNRYRQVRDQCAGSNPDDQ